MFEPYNYYTTVIQVSDVRIGWLDNKGNFLECDWGDHISFAYELISEDNNLYEKYRKSGLDAGSFLVEKLKYILLDNPSWQYTSQHITFDSKTKHPKIQINKFMDLFKDDINKIIDILEVLNGEGIR